VYGLKVLMAKSKWFCNRFQTVRLILQNGLQQVSNSETDTAEWLFSSPYDSQLASN
jgi:hypothetical protein